MVTFTGRNAQRSLPHNRNYVKSMRSRFGSGAGCAGLGVAGCSPPSRYCFRVGVTPHVSDSM